MLVEYLDTMLPLYGDMYAFRFHRLKQVLLEGTVFQQDLFSSQ